MAGRQRTVTAVAVQMPNSEQLGSEAFGYSLELMQSFVLCNYARNQDRILHNLFKRKEF